MLFVGILVPFSIALVSSRVLRLRFEISLLAYSLSPPLLLLLFKEDNTDPVIECATLLTPLSSRPPALLLLFMLLFEESSSKSSSNDCISSNGAGVFKLHPSFGLSSIIHRS